MDISSQDLQKDVDAAREKVHEYESLQRLCANPDFNKIIRKGYLNDYLLKLVQSRTAPNANLVMLDKQLDAVAFFQKYIEDIITNGPMAINEYRQYSESLENFYLKDSE